MDEKMTSEKKEICREITGYFIGDVNDPKLVNRLSDGFHADFDICEGWRKELIAMGFDEIPDRVYTVKITLCD